MNFSSIRGKVAEASFYIIFVAALVSIWGPQMVYLEGHFFPVTSKVTILTQVPTAAGGLDITFSYTKYRFCEVQGFEAKVGQFEIPRGLCT